MVMTGVLCFFHTLIEMLLALFVVCLFCNIKHAVGL